MSILNTQELKLLCDKLNIKITDIISKDLLKNYNFDKSNIFIINFDNYNNKGTHWVAIYNNIYFDSFGLISPYEIEKYFKNNYFYNNSQIQNLNDSFCGWICLYFLYYMCNSEYKNDKTKYKHFIKEFSKNTEDNNDILINKLLEIFNINNNIDNKTPFIAL